MLDQRFKLADLLDEQIGRSGGVLTVRPFRKGCVSVRFGRSDLAAS